MKRTMMLSFAALAALTLAAAPLVAKARVGHAASAALPAGATCDPSHCTGSCPRRAGATAAVGATASKGDQVGACQVSDPSQCPPGCPRHAGDAVAARVTTR